MRKILVLGAFGWANGSLDGQTVKTRDLHRLIKEQFKNEVDYFDTSSVRCNKAHLFLMFWKLIRCKNLAYLPAQNNIKYLFPIIFVLSVLFRFKIHYFVVGGWLREFLNDLPIHRFMLKRIAGIHVETHCLKQELEQYYQFNHVDIFPNFRFFEFDPGRFDSEKMGTDRIQLHQFEANDLDRQMELSHPSLKKVISGGNVLRMCFISRVEQSKGLDTLLEMAHRLSELQLDSKVKIDFYGQKKDDYFDSNLSNIEMFTYRGILQPNEVIYTLQKYDALIFPTHYDGEGCPGILVEALSAALPIIASNWKYNSEFVKDRVNGFLCDTFDVEAYIKAILSISDPVLRQEMKKQSYLMSKNFTASSAREKIKFFFN